MIGITAFKQNPTLICVGIIGWIFLALALMRGPHLSRQDSNSASVSRVSLRYGVLLVPLIVLIFLGGIAPGVILKQSESAVAKWITHIQTRGEKDAG